MIAFGSHNQLQSSLAPLGDLLKALMILSNLNGFSPSPPVQGFNQRKGSSRMWKEKGSKWFCHFCLSLFVFVCALLMCFAFKFWVSLVFILWLFNIFLFGYFSVFLCFVFHMKIKIKIKIGKSEKYKNSVCYMYISTCVPWMAIKTKFSKFCISCNLDEHLYAQLNKWALWLMFMMSTIKLSLKLNTHITLFDGKD